MELSDREKCIFLINNDLLKRSDAIVVLEGDGKARVQFASELYHGGLAKRLVFSGGVKNLAYGSFPFDMLKEEFEKFNINSDQIIVESKSRHTREQALEIILMAKMNSWRKLILVASNYHQLRAFLTFLKVLFEEGLENKIQIFNAPVRNLHWYETTPWGRRIDILETELEKIDNYFLEGHVASYKQLIDYYKWKEGQI